MAGVKFFGLFALVFAVFLYGCEGGGGSNNSNQPATDGGFGVAGSQMARDTAPDATQEELGELVQGNTEFAIDLYHELRAEEEGNLFFSPYSISTALAMAYAGARNETSDEMASVLGLSPLKDKVHAAFNALDLDLASSEDGEESGFKLRIANSTWVQDGYPFETSFLDLLAENYGSELCTVDFRIAPEEARIAINNEVKRQTEGKIEELVTRGLISELTRFVLTNAIYFKATWNTRFDEELTKDGSFNLPNGETAKAAMMHHTENFRYAEGADYQSVELPYKGGETSMVLLLPRAGRFADFENGLIYSTMDKIFKELQIRRVELALPRFNISSSPDTTEALKRLGMHAPFDPHSADFSGIDGGQDLFISAVVHKAVISVDENGTEAAAATAIVGSTTSYVEPVTVTVDRPFIFVIRHINTGTILFMGRITNPTE
ncbi:MAG: serpin family protein [Pseudomonadota bacterium]